MPMHRPLAVSALALALASLIAPAHAADPTTAELLARIASLEQRIAVLEGNNTATSDVDQRLRIVERKQELQQEADDTRAASTPRVALDEKGLSVKSADNNFEVKFRGLVQADGRFFLDDQAQPQNDTFLLRRVEPTLEGSWGKLIGFRLQAQLAGDSASLNDAYVDLKFDPRATLRVGKYKEPFGLEQLRSSGSLAAIERGLPTELTPARDYGAQLQGEFAGGTLNYAVGVFNGTIDGRDAVSSNPDNEFDATGRVFWEPFKNKANGLSGCAIGIAPSVGDEFGVVDAKTINPQLPSYRTPGQVKFFGYRADGVDPSNPALVNVVADGLHRRWSPQAYYYNGPLGLQAEYVTSEQEVRVATGANAGRVAHLENTAWQVVGSWVLTGEDASYKGIARPDHPFAVGGQGWGALELVARYGQLNIDDDAFPLFANPAKSASGAQAWTIGVNWYLTSNFKLVANYTQTSFDAALGAAPREDEKTIFTRAQFSF